MTAYEMRISDWSSDVCSSDLLTQEKRVMPHVHLSLQAGDDMVLTRMKRRHRRADTVRLIERLKAARPDIAIGADLIAGFPPEDDAMFANSLALIDDCDLVFGHIFPYSPRAGTVRKTLGSGNESTVRVELVGGQISLRKPE